MLDQIWMTQKMNHAHKAALKLGLFVPDQELPDTLCSSTRNWSSHSSIQDFVKERKRFFRQDFQKALIKKNRKILFEQSNPPPHEHYIVYFFKFYPSPFFFNHLFPIKLVGVHSREQTVSLLSFNHLIKMDRRLPSKSKHRINNLVSVGSLNDDALPRENR